MPQLSLKVPVFRRWGKKFFVAADRLFFSSLPIMKEVDRIENSEISWLVYPLAWEGSRYSLGRPEVHFTLWEDVISAVREGQEPTPAEIMQTLSAHSTEYKLVVT